MRDEIRIAATPKRKRNQLAKAELWMMVAASHAVLDLGKDMDEWGANLVTGQMVPEAEIMNRYGLSPEDMRRLANQIGDEIETRATHAGYDDAWIHDED